MLGPQTIQSMFFHVLWWLSYTDSIRLPKTFSSFDTTQSDFLEVIIYYFAYYTEKLLSEYQYYGYHIKEEESSVVKGRIKFNKYFKILLRVIGKIFRLNITNFRLIIDLIE